MPETTSRAVRIHATGGPEQLVIDQVSVGEPGPGQVRIRHHAIGLNFIDVYQRTGLYPNAMPLALGMEGAGVIEAVGEGVTHLKVGDRAAYAANPPGSYCDVRVMPAMNVCRLPDAISFETGAAMMLKGLTAQYLLKHCKPVEGLQAGDFVLFHAAAGGVGLIASQWAQALGATVIGTVSTPAKAELARAHGCAHVLTDVAAADLPARVRALTGGKGVRVVYDGIGRDTFMASLDCLAPLGMMVSFGNASGPVAAFEPAMLAQKGSLFLTRPTLFHYVAQRADLLAAADEVFARVADGTVRVAIGQRHALKDCARAHEALAARRTTGSLLRAPE